MATAQPSSPFPLERADRMTTPALLIERGFSLRAANDEDLPWLRKLYASTRAKEMASVPWPEIAKRSFLEQQFGLQHQHYLAHYANADFLAIEHAEHGPVGRYYLQRTAPEHLLIDISLFPTLCGSGVGTALIHQSQHDAAQVGRGMRLHVQSSNPGAHRLYERLGFVTERSDGTHWPMRWLPHTL